MKRKEIVFFELLEREHGRIVRDGLFDEAAYQSAAFKVAFVVNQPNPENLADLRSAITNGEIGHPYDTLAHFANAVRLWPNHVARFSNENIKANERVEAFQGIALINFNKSAGYRTREIKLDVLMGDPFSEMLVVQMKLYEPKLIACFGVEPYNVLISGLGPCEWRDPIEEGNQRQYISMMTSSGQVIVNFGYFRERDNRLGLMYEDFVRLLGWCGNQK